MTCHILSDFGQATTFPSPYYLRPFVLNHILELCTPIYPIDNP